MHAIPRTETTVAPGGPGRTARRVQHELWWTRFNANGDPLLRVLCFPYAGGHPHAFRSWHTCWPPSVELLAIQLPGRASRMTEPAFTRITDLVAGLGPALVPILDRPFVFFGHSLGAVVGFEATRWLRRHIGVLPEHLFVSGRRAPQIPDLDVPNSEGTDEEIIVSLSEFEGTPPEVLKNAELRALLLPALRADFKLGETYEYVHEAPLARPITVFGGTEDSESAGDRLDAWRLQTTEAFAKHLLVGGHFFVHSRHQQIVGVMRTELRRLLDM